MSKPKRILVAFVVTCIVGNIIGVLGVTVINSTALWYAITAIALTLVIVWAVPYIELSMSPRQFFRNNRFRQKDSDA